MRLERPVHPVTVKHQLRQVLLDLDGVYRTFRAKPDSAGLDAVKDALEAVREAVEEFETAESPDTLAAKQPENVNVPPPMAPEPEDDGGDEGTEDAEA